MKKWIIGIFVLAVLAGVVLLVPGSGLSQATASEAVQQVGQGPLPPPLVARAARTTEAEGYVTPIKYAALSFEISGRVKEVLVEKGEQVQAGQVLMRLDTTDWQQRVSEAQTALEVAQSQLVKAQARARPEEIEVARAAVAIQEAQAGTVQAAISVAQAQLAKVQAPAKPEDVIAAKAALKKAEIALRKAQEAYDEISWVNDIKLRPEAEALQQASIDYEAAKAKYEALVRGATAEEIAVAKAQVEQAQAQLPVAKAQIGQARAQLALQEAGPRVEDIIPTKVQVSQAEVALQNARNNLSKTELLAPFAGMVAELPAKEGEVVDEQSPVLTLADFSVWTVETDDLTEIDVVRVEVGQEALVTMDAMPGREFRGRVTKIAPRSETKGGDQTYTVTVELGQDALEAGLRWGMTCLVKVPAE
jgi:multidrug resistance efflux pump